MTNTTPDTTTPGPAPARPARAPGSMAATLWASEVHGIVVSALNALHDTLLDDGDHESAWEDVCEALTHEILGTEPPPAQGACAWGQDNIAGLLPVGPHPHFRCVRTGEVPMVRAEDGHDVHRSFCITHANDVALVGWQRPAAVGSDGVVWEGTARAGWAEDGQAPTGHVCADIPHPPGTIMRILTPAEHERLRTIETTAHHWRNAQRAVDEVLAGRPMDPAAYTAARPVRDAAQIAFNTALDTLPDPDPTQ